MSNAMVMPFSSVFMEPIKRYDGNCWVRMTGTERTAAVLTKPATAPKATLIQ